MSLLLYECLVALLCTKMEASDDHINMMFTDSAAKSLGDKILVGNQMHMWSTLITFMFHLGDTKSGATTKIEVNHFYSHSDGV